MNFFNKIKMNFYSTLLVLILSVLIKQSTEAETTDFEDRIDLGLKIGWTIVRVPSDIAKLLIWKSIKLPSDVSDTVGVKAIVNSLKFATPDKVKRQLTKLRKSIPVHEWKFTVGNYVYTIATGSFGIKAYKSKKILPQLISNLTQPNRKSHGKVSRAFRRSNAKVSKAFKKSKAKVAQAFRKAKSSKFFSSKTNFNNMFKKVRIPKGLKNYFSRLVKR